MGFNFAGFLGGAASQIVKDLDEQEKEVKLRTRTILDRQIQETADNRKEYKANKKKVTEQLNALVPLFGDDKNALAKARSIVECGDTHFNNMFNILQNHANKGGDANTIVKFAPDANITGFKNVEDATNSLVQMASIPAPTFATKPDETTSAFGLDLGTSMFRGYYDKARKQYEREGLLDPMKSGDDSVASYAAAEIDLSGFKKDTKTLEQQKAELVNEVMNIENKNSAEAVAINKKIAQIDSYLVSGSAAIKVAEINANQKEGLTVSQHQNIVKGGLQEIEDKYKLPATQAAIGIDNVASAKEKEIKKFKTDYVKNLIVKGLDTNSLGYIQSDPSLSNIYDKIMEDAAKIKQKNEAFNAEVSKAKELGSPKAYVDSLKGQGVPKQAIKDILIQAYPNTDEDTINTIVG